jgi:hypothetical protein
MNSKKNEATTNSPWVQRRASGDVGGVGCSLRGLPFLTVQDGGKGGDSVRHRPRAHDDVSTSFYPAARLVPQYLFPLYERTSIIVNVF